MWVVNFQSKKCRYLSIHLSRQGRPVLSFGTRPDLWPTMSPIFDFDLTHLAKAAYMEAVSLPITEASGMTRNDPCGGLSKESH